MGLGLLAAGALAQSELRCPSRPDSLVNRAFQVGEHLVYAVKYMGITAGIATMSVEDTVRLGDHLCYVITNRTQSTKEFSVVYKVDDRATSWLDAERFVSRRFEKHLREGDYRADQVVWFFQERNVAFYPSKNLEVSTPACVMDVLAALYYVRLLPLEPGQEILLDHHDNRKNYPLLVKVHRRERVNTDAGTFACVVVEPLMRVPGLFKHKGTIMVWMTDDERHMPVLMKSKIPVGSVNAVLTDYRVEARPGG